MVADMLFLGVKRPVSLLWLQASVMFLVLVDGYGSEAKKKGKKAL
jgi:hypothetical protein